MTKQTVAEFVHELLVNAGCKGARVWRDYITAQCPFHWNKRNFKTFYVSTVEVINKRTGIQGYYFHCFSCGRGGTIPSLIAHVGNCSYQKALKRFERRVAVAGITLDGLREEMNRIHELSSMELSEIELPPESMSQKPMYSYLRKRSRMYHSVLDVEYIVKKYGLYYCNTGRMAGRIIMPVRDTDGRIIGYNDRSIDPDAERKSLHPAGVQYGMMLHGLYESLGKNDCVVTEGAFDMFQVDCALDSRDKKKIGFVDLMGTAFTDDRCALLARHFKNVLLMLDNDKAGKKLTNEILEERRDDLNLWNCAKEYPDGKDPGKCTVKEIRHAVACRKADKDRSYLSYLNKLAET